MAPAGNNDDSDDSDADQAFPADYDPDLDDEEEVLRLQGQEAEAQGDSGAAPESVEAPGEEVEVADPMAEYPEPEQRSIPLDVLLAKANYIREAAAMHRGGCRVLLQPWEQRSAMLLDMAEWCVGVDQTGWFQPRPVTNNFDSLAPVTNSDRVSRSARAAEFCLEGSCCCQAQKL